MTLEALLLRKMQDCQRFAFWKTAINASSVRIVPGRIYSATDIMSHSHSASLLRIMKIPVAPLAPFGSYPNPLGITAEDRLLLHSVLAIKHDQVVDLTQGSSDRQLATEEERKTPSPKPSNSDQTSYSIGRFDENRPNMYSSDLFITNQEEPRTLHVGLDLGGPVGCPVHAFCDGTVVFAGYNEPLGDYGHVVVIEHSIRDQSLFALYGHLGSDQRAVQGQSVQAGDVIGVLGDISENGGWFSPHVHFQLALTKPETHDMPGVVKWSDREQALQEYIDPRYVLGDLY